MGKTNKILVGVTTYAGNFEAGLILRKTLNHLRYKNGDKVFILVISDGKILDPKVHLIADVVLERNGPNGLHQGELDSIWELVSYAQRNGFARLIKTAGDIIMTKPDWATVVMRYFESTSAKLMSTHWFENDSWVVGTKFFVAETNFLSLTLPKSIVSDNLEQEFTRSIQAKYNLRDVAYLINSNTGERSEVTHQLREWGWEHAHRLSKFVRIDENERFHKMLFNKYCFYQFLRLLRDVRRSFKI